MAVGRRNSKYAALLYARRLAGARPNIDSLGQFCESACGIQECFIFEDLVVDLILIFDMKTPPYLLQIKNTYSIGLRLTRFHAKPNPSHQH